MLTPPGSAREVQAAMPKAHDNRSSCESWAAIRRRGSSGTQPLFSRYSNHPWTTPSSKASREALLVFQCCGGSNGRRSGDAPFHGEPRVELRSAGAMRASARRPSNTAGAAALCASLASARRLGATITAVIDVTHFTDLGCAWAYSARPAHTTLRRRLQRAAALTLVMVGLTEDAGQYAARGYTPTRSAVGYGRVRRFGCAYCGSSVVGRRARPNLCSSRCRQAAYRAPATAGSLSAPPQQPGRRVSARVCLGGGIRGRQAPHARGIRPFQGGCPQRCCDRFSRSVTPTATLAGSDMATAISARLSQCWRTSASRLTPRSRRRPGRGGNAASERYSLAGAGSRRDVATSGSGASIPFRRARSALSRRPPLGQ
jgi:hypothetical protein